MGGGAAWCGRTVAAAAEPAGAAGLHSHHRPTPAPSLLPPTHQGYLASLGDPAVTEQLSRRLAEARNMTDEIAALAALERAGGMVGAAPGCVAARAQGLQSFYAKWQEEPLVLLKWFALQVGGSGGWGLGACIGGSCGVRWRVCLPPQPPCAAPDSAPPPRRPGPAPHARRPPATRRATWRRCRRWRSTPRST